MATQSRSTVLPQLMANARSADELRRELTEGPLAAAQQSAFITGAGLISMMARLPDAFIDSQRRELKRLMRSGGNSNGRVEALKASIEQARRLAATAAVGHRRAERLMIALTDGTGFIHGFVSDQKLQPMPGLTVRVAVRDTGEGGSLSSRTDTDGYFKIRLAENSAAEKPAPEIAVKLSERISELLTEVNAKSRNEAGTGKPAKPGEPGTYGRDAILAQVEILDAAGNTLHRDPVPLIVNHGTVYREYVLDGSHIEPPIRPRKKEAGTRPGSADPSDTATAPGKPAASSSKPTASGKTKK